MKKSFAVLSLILIFNFTLYSQSTYREIGLKSHSFNNFSFLFKKEKTTGKYRRYSAYYASNTFIGAISGHHSSIGASIGFEKRKELSDKVDFIRGFNPGVFFSISNPFYPDFTSNAGIRLGYIIGFQYHLTKEFAIGAEMIPSFSINTGFQENGIFVGSSTNFSQGAGIFLIYKFNKK